MNGFFINPNRWYFEVVAWSKDWNSISPQTVTLTSMENLQQIYQQLEDKRASLPPHHHQHSELKALKVAKDFCDLLIVFHFHDLFRRSLPYIKQVKVPISVAVHEYEDFVHKIVPKV